MSSTSGNRHNKTYDREKEKIGDKLPYGIDSICTPMATAWLRFERSASFSFVAYNPKTIQPQNNRVIGPSKPNNIYDIFFFFLTY